MAKKISFPSGLTKGSAYSTSPERSGSRGHSVVRPSNTSPQTGSRPAQPSKGKAGK